MQRLSVLPLTLLSDGATRIAVQCEGERVLWSDEPQSVDLLGLSGVRARVLGFAELKRSKLRPRDDPVEAAKDRVDFASLSELD